MEQHNEDSISSLRFNKRTPKEETASEQEARIYRETMNQFALFGIVLLVAPFVLFLL